MAAPKRVGKCGRVSGWLHPGLCVVLAFGAAVPLPGCTRRFFRHRADHQVDQVLAEKDCDPRWRIDQYHVYPDERARFADPTNPDRPPMPPDDLAAHDLSPNPQKPGKPGVERVEGTGYLSLMAAWDKDNRAEAAAREQTRAGARPQAETQEQARTGTAEQARGGSQARPATKPDKVPAGRDQAGAKGTGQQNGQPGSAGATRPATTTSLASSPGALRPYLLKLEQAVELGLINSREYQDIREDLYLTALPVTLERFAFAVQFFAAEQAVRERAGRETPTGYVNNWTLNSNVGLAKLFSTGALLLLNFANQTVYNLGRDPSFSVSFLTLDLIQPLLRGGGRAVTLEPLTQAERNLLYEIRNFARFRKTFYVAIAGGGGGSITGAQFQPTGVIAPTTFSPAAGVGRSAVTPGVIPSVPVMGNPGLQVNPGPAGQLGLQVALAAPVSGYLATLLQAAQMRVDEYNIEKLEGYLNLARAMQEGGDISQLQVDQFEQQVLTRRTTLLMDQLQYLQSLDQFKLQLGLPTTLPIELDDAAFRPLNEQFQRYEDLFRNFESASNEPLRFGTPEQVGRVRRELRRILTSSAFVSGTRFRTRVGTSWSAWEKLTPEEIRRRLARFREERRQLLARRTDLEEKGRPLSTADQQRLATAGFEIDLGEFEAVLREYESQPWKGLPEPERRRRQQATYRYVVNEFILVLSEARNERVEQLRRQWPDLARLCVGGVDLLQTDLDTAQTVVVQTALTNRLDLMNVRAEVVDAWRQLAVFANALLGTFTVEYRMTSNTPLGHSQPLNIGGSRTTHQLILNGQLPLVRQVEQNNYRASLINYQRARRILQRAEDQVAFDTRGEIRTLRQQAEQYRIQQRQVELAYLTVENSLDTFQAPPAPLVAGQPAPDVATRAAALTSQLITAQTSLYNAQFAMTTIWITYLNTRLTLYRDMELMPLDFRGVWIDDVGTCECPPAPGTAGRGSEPAGGHSASPERPERLPEASSVTPAQGPRLEQAH